MELVGDWPDPQTHSTKVKLMMWYGKDMSEASRSRKVRSVAYTACTVSLILIRYSDRNTTLTAQLPASFNVEVTSSSPHYIFMMWVLSTGTILLLLWLLRRRRDSRKPHNTKKWHCRR
jgi:hypothetical protein